MKWSAARTVLDGHLCQSTIARGLQEENTPGHLVEELTFRFQHDVMSEVEKGMEEQSCQYYGAEIY